MNIHKGWLLIINFSFGFETFHSWHVIAVLLILGGPVLCIQVYNVYYVWVSKGSFKMYLFYQKKD